MSQLFLYKWCLIYLRIPKLYLSETFLNLSDLDGSGDATGDRIFDVSVDGTIPTAFNNLAPYTPAGNAFNTGTVVSHTLISDGTIDLTLIHGSQDPAVKAIEIISLGDNSDQLLGGSQQQTSLAITADDIIETEAAAVLLGLSNTDSTAFEMTEPQLLGTQGPDTFIGSLSEETLL